MLNFSSECVIVSVWGDRAGLIGQSKEYPTKRTVQWFFRWMFVFVHNPSMTRPPPHSRPSSKTSIFSEMNNLYDITLAEEYSNICGVAVEDLGKYFGGHIKELAQLGRFKHIGSLHDEILSIPYQLHINREAYYHSIFLAVMSVLGFDMGTEVQTAKGRIDAVLEIDDKMYFS